MLFKILVSDPMEAIGLDMLRASGHEVLELKPEDKGRLLELLPAYDALVVRSETKVTADVLKAGKNLKVVGRAGIGVDNVDVKAATELGILVVNAPTANLISATEHTFALLLTLARNVAAADRTLKNGKWDRKSFVGTELQGKKLGVIGFGRIGQQVARRARAFDMEILAFDPFLDAEQIKKADAVPQTLDELLRNADVVTLHVPFTEETKNLLSVERLRLLKPGALLINCARGGVVDEVGLLELLDSGHLGGAAFDVFAEEPLKDFRLVQHPKMVATPHLGAQTAEAQERISSQTAKMVLEALKGSLAVSAVNLPFRPAGSAGEPFLHLAERLGHLASWLATGSIKRLEVTIGALEPSLATPIQVAVLRGALRRSMGEAVNYVNAQLIAKERGLETRLAQNGAGDYPNRIAVKIVADQELEIAGSLFHGTDERVVEVDGHLLEFRPKGHLLVVRNHDVPGVVGKLGTLLANAGVNIAEIHLARQREKHRALAVVRVDQPLTLAVLEAVRDLVEVEFAEVIDLG